MHPTTRSPCRTHAVPENHHLWRNGRLWWIAIVVLDPQGLRRRVRRSLGTADLAVARARRDAVLDRLFRAKHWRPSATLPLHANDATAVAVPAATIRSAGDPASPTTRWVA
jgi:hypothetical protein